MWQIKFSAEDVGVVAGAGSDAAEAPAAAASSAAAVAADAAKDPQAAAPAPAEADSEDDSEDFALLGSLLFNPTTQLLKSNHPPPSKKEFDYDWKTHLLNAPEFGNLLFSWLKYHTR